jgi:acyl-CoA reductase-like NAD-dependent aldehyde dehydrogenase
MNAILKNYIAGDWVDGPGISRNINPSNTNDTVGEYAKADRVQTLQAVAAAKAAFPAWSQSTPQVRYDALNRIATEILARKDDSAACWRARKARHCRRESARSPAPDRFLRSSPARRCA